MTYRTRAEPFVLLAHLRRPHGHRAGEWPVRFGVGRTRWPARLCAIRKSRHASERAKKHIVQRASRKQQRVRPETLEFAE
jgi:hypothetical protein